MATARSIIARALRSGALDPHDLACLRFDVLAAVAELEAGIASGVLPPRLRVRGVPLADLLSLDDVVRLLREGGR